MPSPVPVDIAILIALPDELRWFQEIFDVQFRSTQDGVDIFYQWTHVTTSGTSYDLALALAGTMGPTQATLTTERLLQRFTPRLMVNIGIAGGIKDVRLGDVVIPTQVSAYLENSKTVETDDVLGFELSAEVYRCSPILATLMQHLPFAYKQLYEDWKAACAADLVSLFGGEELRQLRESDEIAAATEKRNTRFRDTPEIKTGHTASGPAVAAAEPFKKWLRSRSDRSYLCIEMEAAGMLAATTSAMVQLDSLVIRGVSDFSDKAKEELERVAGDRFRRLAMHNAARLFASLLQTSLLPRRQDSPPEADLPSRGEGSPTGSEGLHKEGSDALDLLPDLASAPVNPRYVRDLQMLEGNRYDLTKIIGAGTIVVAVGRDWPQDVVDRPIAAWMGEVVERYLALYPPNPFHRAIVVSDIAADTQFITHASGLISIGGPNVNRATVRIASTGTVREFPGRISQCFVNDRIPQVALWGGGGRGTQLSATRYVRHQDGLAEFIRMCLEGTNFSQIDTPVEGARVGKSLQVNGSIAHVPDGLHLWLASVSSDGNLHPHGASLTPVNGRWEGKAFLGDQHSLVEAAPFRIKLIGVSATTSEYLIKYLRTAATGGAYTGVAGIPHRVLASTAVTRHG